MGHNVGCEERSLHAMPLCSPHSAQPYMAVLAGLEYDEQVYCPGPWSSLLGKNDWSLDQGSKSPLVEQTEGPG